jgi:MFS family permease
LALFCSVGFLNAYGVFQEYYKLNQLQNMSESDISWIGSVSIFLTYALAPLSGVLVDKIGPTVSPHPNQLFSFRWLSSHITSKKLLLFGSVGQLVAIFMTSLCTQYYQFFLAQALLLGISMCFVTWPPVAVVSRSLPNHRGLALGLVIGGSSIGGVVWPIMLERLLNYTDIGFGWTMRVVGFTMLPLLAVACATVLETPTASTSQDLAAASDGDGSEQLDVSAKMAPKIDLTIAKDKVFILLSLGLAIAYFGLFIPFFYISSYSTAQGVDPQLSFYLISMINGASLLGRIIPGHLADSYGHFNLCLAGLFASAIIAFCWTAVSTCAGLIVWSLAYGFTSGVCPSDRPSSMDLVDG